MTAVVEMHDITKVYGQGEAEVRAVDGISLTVEPGEYVAIMGASGSGKSTVMNIIGALDVATSGTYKIDGVDIGDLDDELLVACLVDPCHRPVLVGVRPAEEYLHPLRLAEPALEELDVDRRPGERVTGLEKWT